MTVRDSWCTEGHGIGRLDLFGDHPGGLAAVGTTGVSLDRAGLPVGVEVTGQVDHGTDNVHHARATSRRARVAVYGKLVPPYLTRVEEAAGERNRPAGR